MKELTINNRADGHQLIDAKHPRAPQLPSTFSSAAQSALSPPTFAQHSSDRFAAASPVHTRAGVRLLRTYPPRMFDHAAKPQIQNYVEDKSKAVEQREA